MTERTIIRFEDPLLLLTAALYLQSIKSWRLDTNITHNIAQSQSAGAMINSVRPSMALDPVRKVASWQSSDWADRSPYETEPPSPLVTKLEDFLAILGEADIKVGSWPVKFTPGQIKVGCTTIDNATVNRIAKNLIPAE